MTAPAVRRRLAARLCEKLAKDVARRLPAGFDRRAATWATVGSADADFLVALSLWEQTGQDGHRDELCRAYLGVLRAAEAYAERSK